MLSAENLKVRYRNGALGIIDVGLEVEAGEVVAVLGPNGAGKTTTVRAISGFLRSEGARVISGRVMLESENITNYEPHRTNRMGIAFIPERQKVFPNMTVAENLGALGHLPSRQRRAELQERVFGLFPVLASRQREHAGRLSGGQQQMLAIARGIMCEARLLIVDELTLGLHHTLHAPLFEVMRTLADAGAAVLVVDESTGHALDIADRCYVLNGGHVRASGPPEMFVGNELLAAGYVEASS